MRIIGVADFVQATPCPIWVLESGFSKMRAAPKMRDGPGKRHVDIFGGNISPMKGIAMTDDTVPHPAAVSPGEVAEATPGTEQAPARVLTAAARRALAEAEARRTMLDEKARILAQSPELRGRGGLDPVRYDDWDVKGIAVDF
jgi:hypothetical protein